MLKQCLFTGTYLCGCDTLCDWHKHRACSVQGHFNGFSCLCSLYTSVFHYLAVSLPPSPASFLASFLLLLWPSDYKLSLFLGNGWLFSSGSSLFWPPRHIACPNPCADHLGSAPARAQSQTVRTLRVSGDWTNCKMLHLEGWFYH